MMIDVPMTLEQYRQLVSYLAAHEKDIANNVNDYGDLKELFVVVFEQEARP